MEHDKGRLLAVSTCGVPLEAIDQLSTELGTDFGLEVDRNQLILKSAGPPSWVTFLAGADWWIKLLAASAAIYVAEIIKEAAKSSWRARSRAIGAAASTGNLVKKLARGMTRLVHKCSPGTTLEVALPIPDDFNSTHLSLEGFDSDELAVQIALFVRHLTALDELIKNQHLAEGGAFGEIYLKLLDDASMEVSWWNKDMTKIEKHVLPLEVPGAP